MEDDVKTNEQSIAKSNFLPWVRRLLTATVFGAVALAVVEARLTLPIPGTGVVTDPREIFTTIGAGLTGPVGGVVIGILAGIREPGGIALASLLAHVSGGLWMGFGYKKLVHERMQMPISVLGWAVLVLAYYYIFAVPGFVIGLALFYGEDTSLIRAYGILGRGALPEALLTTLITTLVFVALPRRHRRPLW